MKNQMIILYGCVRFTSKLDLPTVVELLSEQLFGGAKFTTTDEFDEMPGFRLERPFVGVSVSIYGECNTYVITIETLIPAFSPGNFPKLTEIYLSVYIEQTLATIKELQVIPS